MREKLLLFIFLGSIFLTILPESSPIFGYLACQKVGYTCDCTYSTPTCPNGCVWIWCYCLGCEVQTDHCCNCDSCGCFTGETEIAVGESENSETKQIKDLQPGGVVSSFNPETGGIKEGTVSDITKYTREGYYELETESGKKVRVTGEHPFLAYSENDQTSSTKSQTISKFQNSVSKLEEILSQTLTYQAITSLQQKVNEILK